MSTFLEGIFPEELQGLYQQVENPLPAAPDLPAQVQIPGPGDTRGQRYDNIDKLFDDFTNTPASQDSSLQPYGFNYKEANADRYVQSDYFQEKGFHPEKDNETIYGNRQTFGDTMEQAFAGAGSLAWNTFVDGWKGWGRLAEALFTRDAQKIMGSPEELEELHKEQTEIFNKYAIFRTPESETSIFNRQFFGDLIQQGGFALGTIGQFVSEELVTMGMGAVLKPLTGARTVLNAVRAGVGIGETAKDMKKAGDIWKFTSMMRKMYEGLHSAGTTLRNAARLTPFGSDLIKAVREGATGWELGGAGFNAFRRTVAEANMAFTEARMEAAGTYGELSEQLRLETLKNKGTISPEDEQRISDLSAKAAWGNFKTNAVLIAGMNRLQLDNMFRTFGSDKRMLRQMVEEGSIVARTPKESLARTVTGVAARDVADEAGKIGVKKGEQLTRAYQKGTFGTFGNLGAIASDFGGKRAAWEASKSVLRNTFKWEFTEGIQEMLQDVSGNAFKSYYSDIYNNKEANLWTLAGQAAKDEVSGIQGWKTFLMGAVTGRLMSPLNFGISKGTELLTTSSKDRKAAKESRQQSIKTLNGFFANPNQYAQEWIANTNVQNLTAKKMEWALENKDKYVYEHAKDSAFAKAVTAAKKLNMVESLTDTIREFGNHFSEQEFREAFMVDFNDDNRQKVRDYMNQVADQVGRFSKRYDKLFEEYGDLIRPERYNEADQPQLKLAKQALHEAIEWMATNEYRAGRAAQRGLDIMGEAAKIPGVGEQSHLAFRILSDDHAIVNEMELLSHEIERDRQSTTLTDEIKDRIQQKQKQLESLQTFAVNKDFFSENGAENQKAADDMMSALANYFISKNKEAGFTTTFTQKDIGDLFFKLNDYRKLKKDEKDFLDAYALIANPKKFLAIYSRIHGALTALKIEKMKAAAKAAQSNTNNNTGQNNNQNNNNNPNNPPGTAPAAPATPPNPAAPAAPAGSTNTGAKVVPMSSPEQAQAAFAPGTSATVNEEEEEEGAENNGATSAGIRYKTGDFLYHERKKAYYYVNKTSADKVELVNLENGRVFSISSDKLVDRMSKDVVKKTNPHSFFGENKMSKEMKILPQSRGGLFIVRLDPEEGTYIIVDKDFEAVQEDELNTYESFHKLEDAIQYMQEILQRRARKQKEKTYEFDGVSVREGDILLDKNNKEYKVLSKKPVLVNGQSAVLLKRLDTEREFQVYSLQPYRQKGKAVVKKAADDKRFKMRDPREAVKVYAHVRNKKAGDHQSPGGKEQSVLQALKQKIKERLARVLRTIPQEKLPEGLALRVTRNSNPSTRRAREGYEDQNDNLLLHGEPISVELLYNGESIGFVPYYNRYQYYDTKAKKSVPTPQLTGEQFAGIFDTSIGHADQLLHEFKEAHRSGEVVYDLLDQELKKAGSSSITLPGNQVKELFDMVVSPGQYDWAEEPSIPLKDFTHNSIGGNKVVLVKTRKYNKDYYEEEVTPILEQEVPEEDREKLIWKIDQSRFRNEGKEDLIQNMSSYVAVVELPNGQVRFLDLEVPQVSGKDLASIVEKLNKQMEKSREENQNEEDETGVDDVGFNDGFNNQVLGKIFIATRNKNKGTYLNLRLNAAGDLVLFFEGRKRRTEGEILVKANDENAEPLNGGSDLIEQINAAIEDHDSEQAAGNKIGVTLKPENFKQHIDRDAGFDQLGDLLVKVSSEVVKNQSLSLKAKDYVARPFEVQPPASTKEVSAVSGESTLASVEEQKPPTVERRTDADELKQLVEEQTGDEEKAIEQQNSVEEFIKQKAGIVSFVLGLTNKQGLANWTGSKDDVQKVLGIDIDKSSLKEIKEAAQKIYDQLVTQQRKATSAKEIEAKKADIERRRQEAYDKLVDTRLPIHWDSIVFDETVEGKKRKINGVSDVIDYVGRKIVIINVNGRNIPFYLSTGHGGKADVTSGKWYPFFGIGSDGWLNKLSGKEINNYYGSNVLRGIAEALDRKIGDVRNDKAIPKVGSKGSHIDAINKDLIPTDNRLPTTRESINSNINDTADFLEKEINAKYDAELKELEQKGQVKPEGAAEGIAPSTFENKKADIERRTQEVVQEIENFVNKPEFANTELLSKNWKTRKELFENKVRQLKELIKKGIKTGEDVLRATNLINDIRGTLNEGFSASNKELNAETQNLSLRLASTLLESISDNSISEYIELMEEKVKRGGNSIDKLLLQYSDKSGYTLDGKNFEYFLTREMFNAYKAGTKINAKYDAELAALKKPVSEVSHQEALNRFVDRMLKGESMNSLKDLEFYDHHKKEIEQELLLRLAKEQEAAEPLKARQAQENEKPTTPEIPVNDSGTIAGNRASVSGNDVDLKGGEKPLWMMDDNEVWQKTKEKGNELIINDKKGREKKVVVKEKSSPNGPYLSYDGAAYKSVNDEWKNILVPRAIDQGKYQQAIAEGRMTAHDAKTIIESAGLAVPKDILQQVQAEPSNDTASRIEVSSERPAPLQKRPVPLQKLEGARNNPGSDTRAFLAQLNNRPEQLIGWEEIENGKRIKGITDKGNASLENLGGGAQFIFYNSDTKVQTKYFVRGDAEKMIAAVEKYLRSLPETTETGSTSPAIEEEIKKEEQQPPVSAPNREAEWKSIEAIPYEKRTDQQHADFIRGKFIQAFTDKGVPQEQVEAAVALMEARAQVASPHNPDSWYRRIQDIGKGEFQDQTPRQYQLPNGEKVMGMPTSPEVVNGFYSPIEKKLLESKANNLSATRWKELFGKGDEARFTGLLDFLNSKKPNEQVTKQEIHDFLANNRIEIVEVVRKDNYNRFPITKAEAKGAKYRSYDLYDDKGNQLTSDALIDAANQVLAQPAGAGLPTKYSSYQLSGEKGNYKEVLVTLPGRPKFSSANWTEPNVIVHLRMNTRKDAEGRKILFIEELQSDAGQEKKKGLIDWEAPFLSDTNSWTKLGIKTALKYAVEEGADSISWTSGSQQNERYDLNKQLQSVSWWKEGEGENAYGISAFDKNEHVVLKERGISIKRIEDLLGKEVAQKIKDGAGATKKIGETQYGELEGNDLRLQGNGMKGFYGEPGEGKEGIIGGVAKALVRELTDKEGKINETRLENGQSIQHSIEITPALKAAVEKGRPLFQKKGGKAKGAVETLANGRKIIHALHAPDFSTAVHEIAHVFEGELSESERNIIQKWAGTKTWTTQTSEAFARGFERYLREGNAPTASLKSIFEKAKKWLQAIYRRLIGSPIEKKITPEVKKVFDGLFLPKEVQAPAQEAAAPSAVVQPKPDQAAESVVKPVPEKKPKRPEISPKVVTHLINETRDLRTTLAALKATVFGELMKGKTRKNLLKVLEAVEKDARVLAIKQRMAETDSTLSALKMLTARDLRTADVVHIKRFKKWVQQNLPEGLIQLEVGKQQLSDLTDNMLEKGVKIGQFVADIRTVNGEDQLFGEIGVGAGMPFKYHEAFHAVFRLLLSEEQVQRYLSLAKKEMAEELARENKTLESRLNELYDTNPGYYDQLSREQLEERLYEEYLADKFDEWKKDHTIRISNIIKQFFRLLRQLADLITKKSSRSEIEALFYEINAGKYKNAAVADNRFTNKLRQTRERQEVHKDIRFTEGEWIQDEEGRALKIDVHLPPSKGAALVASLTATLLRRLDREEEQDVPTLLNDMLDEYARLYDKRRDHYLQLLQEDEESIDQYFLMEEELDNLHDLFTKGRQQLINAVRERFDSIDLKYRWQQEQRAAIVNEKGAGALADYRDKDASGGFDTMPKELLKYLSAIAVPATDDFGNQYLENGEPLLEAVDVRMLYSGLQKAAADAKSIHELLLNLWHFSRYNEQCQMFLRQFYADTGLELTDDGYRLTKPGSEYLLRMVVAEFQRYSMDILSFEKDVSEGKMRLVDSLQWEAGPQEFSSWYNAYSASFETPLLAKAKEEKEAFIEQAVSGLRLFESYATDTELTDKELNAISQECSHQIRERIGISLHPQYIAYSLAAIRPAEKRTEFQQELVETNKRTKPFTADQAHSLSMDLFQQKKLFRVNEDATDVKEQLTDDAPQEDLDKVKSDRSILSQLSYANSSFDEVLLADTYENEIGEARVTRKHPDVTIARVQELINGLAESGEKKMPEPWKKDPFFENHYLLSRSEFRQMAAHLRLALVSGMKIPEARWVWARDPIDGRVYKRVEQGVIYNDYTDRDFVFNLIDPYFINKEYSKSGQETAKEAAKKQAEARKKEEEKKKGRKKPVREEEQKEEEEKSEEQKEELNTYVTVRHVLRVPGPSERLYSINLPVTKAVEIYRNEFRLTKEAEAAFIAEVRREYLRIQQVQREIKQIGKDKKDAEADKNFVRKTEEIKGYHTEGANGERPRGLTLFKTGPMLGVLAKHLEQAALNHEDFSKHEKEIKKKKYLQKFWFDPEEGVLNKVINTLLDMGAIAKGNDDHGWRYDNRMLPYYINQGFSGPKGTFNHRRNQLLNLEEGDIEFNIAQILVNDFLNTHAFNQLLYGDPARSFGSFEEMATAAGDAAVSGPSVAFDQAAPALGVDHPGLKSHVVYWGPIVKEGPKEQEHQDQVTAGESAETANKEQGQKEEQEKTWVTIKALRYLLFGLGKLTPRLANQLDRLDAGESIPASEMEKEGGIGQYLDGTHGLQFVYNDGKRHIELSGQLLTKAQTSRQDDDGHWHPLPGKEALHQLLEQLEDYEDRKESFAIVVPLSASKGEKANVATDLNALSDWNFRELDNRFWRLVEKPLELIQQEDDHQEDALTAEIIRSQYEKTRNELFSIQGDANDIRQAIAEGRVRVDLGAFQQEAVRLLESEGIDSQILEFYSLDEKGEPRYNLNGPLTIEKFTELVFAYLSKRMPPQKTPLRSSSRYQETGKAVSSSGEEISGKQAVKKALDQLKQDFPLLKKRLESRQEDVDNPVGKLTAFSNHKGAEKTADPTHDWLLPFDLLHSFAVQLREQNSKGEKIGALQINGIHFNSYENAQLFNPDTGHFDGANRGDLLSELAAELNNREKGLADKLGLHPESVDILGNMVAMGVPLYWGILFLQQPVIQEYYRKLKNGSSPIKTGTNAKEGLHTIGEDLLEKKKKEANIKEPKALTAGLLQSNLTMRGRDASDQYSVLAAFLQLQEQTEYYTALKGLLKTTGQMNKGSFDLVQKYMDKLQLEQDDAGFEASIVPMDLRQVLMGNNKSKPYDEVMTTRIAIHKELQSLLTTIFLSRTPFFQDTRAAVLANLDIDSQEQPGFIQQFDLDLAAALGILAYKKQLEDNGQKVRLASLTNGLLYDGIAEKKPQGFLNCIEILNAIKEKLPDNYFAGSFLQAIGTRIVTDEAEIKQNPYNKDGINKVEINTWAKLHRFNVEKLQDGFLEIYQNEETNYLAWALFHYLLVKDGGQWASGSFIKFAANFMFKDVLDATGRVNQLLARQSGDAAFEPLFGMNQRQLMNHLVSQYLSHPLNIAHVPSRNLREASNLLRYTNMSPKREIQNYNPDTHRVSEKGASHIDFDFWGGLNKKGGLSKNERKALEEGGFEFVNKNRNQLTIAQLKFLKNIQSFAMRNFKVKFGKELPGGGNQVQVEFPFLVKGKFENKENGTVFEALYRLETVDGKKIYDANGFHFVDEANQIAIGTSATYVEEPITGSLAQWKGAKVLDEIPEDQGSVREPVPIRNHPGFSLEGYRTVAAGAGEKKRGPKPKSKDPGPLIKRFEMKYGVQIRLVEGEGGGVKFVRKGKPVQDQSGLHQLFSAFMAKNEVDLSAVAPAARKSTGLNASLPPGVVNIHQGNIPFEEARKRIDKAYEAAKDNPEHQKMLQVMREELEEMYCKKGGA